MLTVSAWPDRAIYVVSPARGPEEWLDRQRICAAVLDLHREQADVVVVDLASDIWVETSRDRRGGTGPVVVSRYDLVDQQQWAEDGLKALSLPRIVGRWPEAIAIDVQDEDQWVLARTYSTAALGVMMLDQHRETLAVLEDAGMVITVALDEDEKIRLQEAVPSANVAALDPNSMRRCTELLAQQADLCRRGRPEYFDHLRSAEARQRRRRERQAHRESPTPEPHPADDYRVEVSVTTEVLPGRRIAEATVQLNTHRLGTPGRRDSQDRIYEGVFPISLEGLSAGAWPDGAQELPCHLHTGSQRLCGEHAVLVADVPGRELVPDSGRPPLHDNWGLWVPWPGWSVWVEQAAEDDIVLTTPVSWQHDRRDDPGGDSGERVPDAIVTVRISLRRRRPAAQRGPD